MQSMLDYGVQVFRRQDNCYKDTNRVAPKEIAPATMMDFDKWFSREQEILSDPDLDLKGNYKMFYHHGFIPADRVKPE